MSHLWDSQFNIYYYKKKENNIAATNNRCVYGKFRPRTLNKAHIEIIFTVKCEVLEHFGYYNYMDLY